MEIEVLKYALDKDDEAYNNELYREFHCPCGCDEFKVSRARYRTVATCSNCDAKYVVHDG